MATTTENERVELFAEVCSTDFLGFSFNGRAYRDQIAESVAKTKELAGVKVEVVTLPGVQGNIRIVWVTHSFGFLGGSLGCAEGEKVCRAFEYAREHKHPICIQCRTGGARMQEGTQSLMQMAKVSSSPFLSKNFSNFDRCLWLWRRFVETPYRSSRSLMTQPMEVSGHTGLYLFVILLTVGVSASYAMQADVKIAVSAATRIGFAGPQVQTFA
jgi:acetyl-CoA carboxylase beta subunit